MRFIWQSGGIAELGIFHAQQLGLLIHQFSKLVFAASDMLRQGDAGVVPGLNDHPFEEIRHFYAGTFPNKHFRSAGAPRLDANRHLFVNVEASASQFLLDHIARHDLCQTGRRIFLLSIVLCQHLAGLRIN